MMVRKLGLIVILSVWSTTAVFAAAQAALPREKVQPAAFPQLAAQIRTDMAPGGRYMVKSDERAEVDADLSAMERIFQGHSSLNELNAQQQIDVFNRQERINALLTKRDGDELICHREKLAGSHMVQSTCLTRRDVEKTARQTQDYMKNQPRPTVEPGGSPH